MSNLTMTALISAGGITGDDEMVGLIQGLTYRQSKQMAAWLALATGGPVHLAHRDELAGTGWADIKTDPAQVRERDLMRPTIAQVFLTERSDGLWCGDVRVDGESIYSYSGVKSAEAAFQMAKDEYPKFELEPIIPAKMNHAQD